MVHTVLLMKHKVAWCRNNTVTISLLPPHTKKGKKPKKNWSYQACVLSVVNISLPSMCDASTLKSVFVYLCWRWSEGSLKKLLMKQDTCVTVGEFGPRVLIWPCRLSMGFWIKSDYKAIDAIQQTIGER